MGEGSTASGAGSTGDTAGALDALLRVERDIAATLSSASIEAERIVEEARAEALRRRQDAVSARRAAIDALDGQLRADCAAAIARERERTVATCRRFDDATDEQVHDLARRAAAELFELEQPP